MQRSATKHYVLFPLPSTMVVVRRQPQRAPEVGPNAGSGSSPKSHRTHHKDLVPESDIQLAELGVYAAGVWQQQPWLTLRFCTAAAFAPKAAAYQAAVNRRISIGADRPTTAQELLTLEMRINEQFYRVRGMLVDKYDRRKAKAYFPKMGISKQAEAYTLPRERSKRGAALTQLVAGLTDEGFITRTLSDGTVQFPYGTGYWAPIATEYNRLLKELTDATGAISDAVGNKDTLREEIETVLRSLAKVLEGNYPVGAEYKAQLRFWGFQRESY